MCSGHRKTSPPPQLASVAGSDFKTLATPTPSLLLELASSDDLTAFKKAVEDDGLPIEATAPWYGRSVGRRMGFQQRTPLMIAALYGSTAVLKYVLASSPAEACRHSSSDGATPLHCAASGGAGSSLDVVKLLIDASADVESVDAAGNRPGEVIARQFSISATRALEIVLKAPAATPSSSPPRASSPVKEETKQGEKKEYPPDSTLPDIKNGIYSTDEFRMYTFKVKPCSRAYTHDWTECPFVHPGENARRRDPRKFSYSCVPCLEFRKGSCLNGDACEYAHGVFECWLHPAQYRTRLCKDETGCNRRVCFFAHKPEELRQVNPSAASVAGMALPSPSSSSPGVSSLDMATALMLMQQQQQGSPMSPSASAGLGTAAAWLNQSAGMITAPSLQLPSSRLKASLSARDLDFDLDLLGLEGYQQKLIDVISASPRANWDTNSFTSASNYGDLLGSVDPSLITQLQGLPVKQAGSQFKSPTGIQMRQSQLLSGYSGSLPPSPPVSATSSFGTDHSMAKAIMNSRASAFAKRSQSFVDRGTTAGRQSTLSAMSTAVTAPSVLPDWSSPDGKLDWGIQGEELNKLRKSASFGFRNNQGAVGGGSGSSSIPPGFERDLSRVQSPVKDGTAAQAGRIGIGRQAKQNRYQLNGSDSDFQAAELFSLWPEHEKIMA